MFHGHLDCFQKPPLGGRPNTKPGDHGTPNAHNRWFILFYHVWGPAWIEIHWNSIWLRAWSHMTSHYTWGSMTTLHDFGDVLGRPLDTFIWALTMSWSRLSVRVWSGPYYDTIPISRMTVFLFSMPFGSVHIMQEPSTPRLNCPGINMTFIVINQNNHSSIHMSLSSSRRTHQISVFDYNIKDDIHSTGFFFITIIDVDFQSHAFTYYIPN